MTSAARSARQAARTLRSLTRAQKDGALRAVATYLRDPATIARIVAANVVDVERARQAGTSESIIDRLSLTPERIVAIADAVDVVVALPDPVGEIVRGYRLPNGLDLRQVRVPFGVIGMIYEARPNVTVDAAVLALKSGNAVLLRGSSSAAESNGTLVAVMREALADTDVPADAISQIPSTSHQSVTDLITARGLVDLVIPRGGAGLIDSVVMNATVPVIETGVGNCHIYVDASADLDQALDILLNAKTQRPSVCNAAETVLVHAAVVDEFLPRAVKALDARGVTIHGDAPWREAGTPVGVDVVAAGDDDWTTEYLSLDIAAAVVDSVEAATDHISRYSSGHTEAIIARDADAIDRFVAQVDSAAIVINASTRFTDGGEFGFGAEIGISTQKMHARGPMGLSEMTTTTYIVRGNGQVRS